MKNDCLFCAIAAGEIPSNKVYEDDLCYAFYDIAPQAPTHFLVIPKEHIGSVAEIGAENSAVVAHLTATPYFLVASADSVVTLSSVSFRCSRPRS